MLISIYLDGVMEECLMGNGKIIKCKEKVNLLGKMEEFI